MVITQITDLAKCVLREYICSGDLVVDATLGNGNDALFLAELVGINGEVYAFDIDINATESCAKKFKNEYPQITIIHDSHENIDAYLGSEISAAVFNLGYLPGSDHQIYTQSHTTLSAIKKILKLLKPSGILSIASYVDHDDYKEFREIKEFMKNLNSKDFKVMYMNPENQSEKAPKLFMCQKIN